MSYLLALAVVPRHDDQVPGLPMLTRARIAVYPFIRREWCQRHPGRHEEVSPASAAPECCLWDDARIGRRFSGWLWLDRYGRLPASHPVADEEDEARLVADVNIRDMPMTPSSLVRPSGVIYHCGDRAYGDWPTRREAALFESRLMDHPGHYAVPFACHW